MTICTPYNGIRLKRGQSYSKSDLFDNIQGYEKVASTYYDPSRNLLFSFFSENHNKWKTEYEEDTNNVYFCLRNAKNPGKISAWELKINRHVFLRRKKQKSGLYEYLGISIGETSTTKNKKPCRVFSIHP